MDEAYIDLLTLQDSIQEGLEDLFPDKLWVKAEVSSIQVKSNGHCYMDLCQSGTGGVVAKAKAEAGNCGEYSFNLHAAEPYVPRGRGRRHPGGNVHIGARPGELQRPLRADAHH